MPMYVDGTNYRRDLGINFPSEDYVKNLIATFPYIQASVSGRYITVGNESNAVQASITTDARTTSFGLKAGWQLVRFDAGAGAQENTFNVTGTKWQTKQSLTNGNNDNPSSYITKITVTISTTRRSSRANATLNSFTINFLKS